MEAGRETKVENNNAAFKIVSFALAFDVHKNIARRTQNI
jgi:hypothetical protein